MSDKKIIDHINELAREEHELFQRESKGGASAADQQRLQELGEMLDQCWDLLRQRRAKREFGEDPGEAHMRSRKTVGNYTG